MDARTLAAKSAPYKIHVIWLAGRALNLALVFCCLFTREEWLRSLVAGPNFMIACYWVRVAGSFCFLLASGC